MLLLDVDGKVVWEGEPGFQKGKPWKGEETLLDVPLRELVRKRKLKELALWRQGWPAARAALAAGDFAGGLAALREGAGFDAAAGGEAAEAVAAMEALKQALAAPEELAAKLGSEAREPALATLAEWGELIGTPLAKSRPVNLALKHAHTTGWNRVPGILKPALVKAAKDPAALASAADKIEALGGAFAAEAAARVRELAADPAALEGLPTELPRWPGRWLAHELFGL